MSGWLLAFLMAATMSFSPMTPMSPELSSMSNGEPSSEHSCTAPSIFSTKTEFSFTTGVDEPDEAMPATLTKNTIPTRNVKTNKPQSVAKKYFKKLFIMVN